jgi:hypothetical protein
VCVRGVAVLLKPQVGPWCFADADSAGLAEPLGVVSCDFIDDCSPDVAAESLCDAVLACMGTCLSWPSVRVQSLFSLSIS